MGIKVQKINDTLCVVIPLEYKEPYWLESMYYNRYTKMDDGSIIIPCRDCNVTITKPILQRTNMGMIQQNQVTTELWKYFDVPELSLLVNDGEDLLETWSINDLKLELKETQQLEGAKKDENIS